MVPTNRSMIRKAMRVVKLSVLLVGAFSTVAVFLHFAVPWVLSRDLVVTLLPAAWTFAGAFLVPPYLFITVNFIIVVIWALPEKMHHHHHHNQYQSDGQPERPIEMITSPKPTVDHERLHRTADAQSQNSSYSAVAVAPAGAADSDETQVAEAEALSLEETWEVIKSGPSASVGKTVLEKSEPWETFGDCRRRAPVARNDAVVVGKDELNMKVEAFIKKMNEQIGLQGGDYHP